jgi:hypothetical protein
MTRSSDCPFEMEDRFSFEQADDILAGRVVGDPVAAEVAQVVADLRGLLEEPHPWVATRHLAAMEAAAADIGPVRLWQRARRSPRVAAAFSLVGALSLTTGLAAAGALPRPAQHAVAVVVSHVGLDLPDDTRVPTPDTTVTTGSTEENQSSCESGDDRCGSGSEVRHSTTPSTKAGGEHQDGCHRTRSAPCATTPTTGAERQENEVRPDDQNDTSTTVTTEDISHRPPDAGSGGGGGGGGDHSSGGTP